MENNETKANTVAKNIDQASNVSQEKITETKEKNSQVLDFANKLGKNMPESDKNLTHQYKTDAALSYLPGLATLALQHRNDEFSYFHARQAIVVNFFFFAVLTYIAIFGYFVVINIFLALIALIIISLGYATAISGKKFQIPFVHHFAKNLDI